MTNNLEEQRLLCSFDSSPDQCPPSLFLGPSWDWEAPPSKTNSPISLALSSGCHLAGFLTAPASHALPAGTGSVCLLRLPLHLNPSPFFKGQPQYHLLPEALQGWLCAHQLSSTFLQPWDETQESESSEGNGLKVKNWGTSDAAWFLVMENDSASAWFSLGMRAFEVFSLYVRRYLEAVCLADCMVRPRRSRKGCSRSQKVWVISAQEPDLGVTKP